MAPLIANLSTHASRSTRPSALTSNMRMPHVFVIPPEEEQRDNPPWCCFDADEQPDNSDFPSNPDIHFLDVPYLVQQSEWDAPAPTARRTAVHRPRPRPPIWKKLEKTQRPEAVKIIEKPPQARQRDTRRDSDVVEVIKVKRGREALTDLEENIKVKRSKTLKARATKALRSIKNVGKGSHRTHVKELWTSSESMPGIFKGVQEQIRSQQDQAEHRPPTPITKRSLSRASSRSLSQIFRPASRPGSSLTIRVAPSVALTEAYSIPSTSNPSSFPHHRYNVTNSSFNEVSSTLTTDDAMDRPVSPSPSMKQNTKFPVRELHRLFSFSSSSPDEASSAPTATTVPFSSARSSSMATTSTSTLSSDYLEVPMEEDIYADAHLLDLQSADRKSVSRYSQEFRTRNDGHDSNPRRLSDLSLEMRLDSLHFDALSFDPEDFDVSLERNILR